MKEIGVIIILFAIVKLTSYGVWNVKKDKNYAGLAGVVILDIAICFELAALIIKMLS